MNTKPEIKQLSRRTSIFIGSSSESLPVAKALKSLFDEKEYNVDIWDEGIFGKGKSNVDNLLKFSDTYDYAIFVFVPDDEIIMKGRKIKGNAPRHNIVFEFGLFLGRIGAKKTYIVAEDSIKKFIRDIFTDLQGISLGYTFKFEYARIKEEGIDNELKNSLSESVKEIKDLIEKADKELQISFLPSTALAIGYFENFVSQIYNQLHILKNESLDGKLVFGNVSVDFNECNFQIYIVIPSKLSEASHKNLQVNLKDLGLIYERMITPSRPFMVYHKKALSPEMIRKEGLNVFDIPSTLYSSLKAIEILSAEPKVVQLMSEKEIANFKRSLMICIENDERKKIKEHIKIVNFEDIEINK